MDFIKNSKINISIVYFLTVIVAAIGNLYLIAEAPVRWYNWLFTGVFMLAKTLFCVSEKKSKFSVWVTLVAFLAALYACIIFSVGSNNYFAHTSADLMYLITYLPYGALSAFIANSEAWLISVPVLNFVYFVIAFITSRKHKTAE